MISRNLKRMFVCRWEKFFLPIFLGLPLITVLVALGVHRFEHGVIVEGKISSADAAFQGEVRGALLKTEEALRDGMIREFILDNDTEKIEGELKRLAERYGLTTMVAVDRQGIALARIPSPRKGDLVFQTTPWGQSAAQGVETVLVGPGRNYPLIINSAVPIIQDMSVRGAIFGGYILDDVHAANFKKEYLGAKDEVVFYSVETGIYGASFSDPEVKRLFGIAFNEGSDVIQGVEGGLIAGHLRIGGTIFHVGNIKFKGENGKAVGGMFVLTPAHTNVPPFMAALIGLILVLPLILHVRKTHGDGRYFGVIFVATLVLVAVGTGISVKIIRKLLYDVTYPTLTIYNSTMEFDPQSDIFRGTGEQRIGIKINTGGEVINVARASVVYDPRRLHVAEIRMDRSFCEERFLIEKKIDNVNGKAIISCGMTGGFSGATAVLADLMVQPLEEGEVSMQFADGTQVLAYDGLGTDVLRMATNGSYQVIGMSGPAPEDGAILFSYSHPNPSRWYSDKIIHVAWILPGESREIAYVFDQNPSTVPDGTARSTKGEKDFLAEDDGVYYFHAAPIGLGRIGPVSHLKILIDTTPPSPPGIQVSAKQVREGDVVRFELSSRGDDASGLQKNFYVQFDDKTWFPTASNLFVPFFDSGTHRVSVRVFDNAGNYSDRSAEITVQ